MRRAVVLGCVVVSLVAASVGCAQVPGSSPPVAVRDVQGAGDDPLVQTVVEGPRPGMTADELVNAFLTAASAEATPGSPVARSYLTRGAAPSWRASDPVTVYESGYSPREIGPYHENRRTVRVTITPTATVSPDGAYTARENDTAETVPFSLRKERGEWRISDLPSGLYIKKQDFNIRYRPVNVYFLSPTRDVVVPDARYFAVAKASLPNRLIEALIEGPSEWLGPAVVNALPQGAALRHSVLNKSPMTVDLTGLAVPNGAKLRRLAAQIVWTLSQTDPIVNAGVVRILADGQELAVPDIGVDQQPVDWQSFDPAANQNPNSYSLRDGAVWRRGTDKTKAIDGPAGEGEYDLSSVAVSLGDYPMLAGIRRVGEMDQLYVGRRNGELRPIYSAEKLTTPTWGGGQDQVWVVRDGRQLVRVPLLGEAQILNARELWEIRPIRALRFSLDGTRVAAIGKGGTLYVGRVNIEDNVRTVDGLRNVAPTITGVIAVSWYGSDTLAALAPTTESTQVVPWVISVDGSVADDQPVNVLPGAPTGIAAAQDRSLLISADGLILYYGQRADERVWKDATYGSSDPPKTLFGEAPTYTD